MKHWRTSGTGFMMATSKANESPSGASEAWLAPLNHGSENRLKLDETRAYDIGRGIDNDLVVASCYASSRHARLFATAGKWSVQDLMSKNGVVVNGRRIEGVHRLCGGEKLEIGGASYRFSLATRSSEKPAGNRGPQENSDYVSLLKPHARRLRFGVPLLWLALILGIGLSATLTLHYFYPDEPEPQSQVTASTDASEANAVPRPEKISRAGAELRALAAHPRDVLTNSEPSLRSFSMVDSRGVHVLDYPSLAALGDAFNRIAVLFEEKGMPRDRVVSWDELSAYLQREGLIPATFYYGHNYRSDQLARFFNLVAADRLALSAGEKELRNKLLADGILHKRGGQYRAAERAEAILAVSQEQGDDPTTLDRELIDLKLRYAILRHELSHGLFYTDSPYRRYVLDFWKRILSEQERAAFRTYLEESHYNPEDEVMMANEMQAYLFHTPDTRAFQAADVGISPERVAELRRRFHKGAPPSQLIDAIPPLATLRQQTGSDAEADDMSESTFVGAGSRELQVR